MNRIVLSVNFLFRKAGDWRDILISFDVVGCFDFVDVDEFQRRFGVFEGVVSTLDETFLLRKFPLLLVVSLVCLLGCHNLEDNIYVNERALGVKKD